VHLESAEAIVSIQTQLTTRKLTSYARDVLTTEQRRLWDKEHAGRSYDEISHDVWRFRTGRPYESLDG
jgi:hypothetical protein